MKSFEVFLFLYFASPLFFFFSLSLPMFPSGIREQEKRGVRALPFPCVCNMIINVMEIFCLTTNLPPTPFFHLYRHVFIPIYDFLSKNQVSSGGCKLGMFKTDIPYILTFHRSILKCFLYMASEIAYKKALTYFLGNHGSRWTYLWSDSQKSLMTFKEYLPCDYLFLSKNI